MLVLVLVTATGGIVAVLRICLVTTATTMALARLKIAVSATTAFEIYMLPLDPSMIIQDRFLAHFLALFVFCAILISVGSHRRFGGGT